MSDPTPVDRCVCARVRFDELLRLHRAEGLSLADLRRRTGCCEGCSTCEPYVRLTLRTGRTRHPVYTDGDLRALLGG